MNINDLPPEMITKIFSYLPIQYLMRMSFVCKYWENINRDYSWKNHPLTYNSAGLKHLSSSLRLMKQYAHKIENIIFRCVTSEEIRKILRFVNLTTLDLVMCAVDKKLIDNLSNHQNIKFLSIKNCYVFGNRSNMHLLCIQFKCMPHLEVLLLSDFGLNDKNMAGLLECTKLNELFIEKIRDISQENITKLLVKRKERLRSLGIFCQSYTDDVTKHVSECKNLTKLRMIRCDRLTDISLNYLLCLNLTQLIMWNNTQFTSGSLKDFFESGNLCNLTVLSLSKISNLTIELLPVIANNCPLLVSVGIYRCPLLTSVPQWKAASIFSNAKVFFE